MPVDFVGHPLLDVLPLDLDRAEARRRLGVDPGESLIGLLPGSRREEVERLLPPMLVAAKRLAAAGVARRFALGLAPTVDASRRRRLVKAAVDEGGPRVDVVERRTYEVMAAADVVLISSGTATLEAALLGAPMVVCYRVSRVTEAVVRLLVKVRWMQPAEPDREPRGRARGAPGRRSPATGSPPKRCACSRTRPRRPPSAPRSRSSGRGSASPGSAGERRRR